MLENIRTAVKRQKKIIIIFLLTIFLPALVLGIFGIRAIRSERFRLARQTETEFRRVADSLISAIDSRLTDLESFLRNLSRSEILIQGNPETIKTLIKSSLMDHPLCDRVFIVFKNDKPWFPLFQPASVHLPQVADLEYQAAPHLEKAVGARLPAGVYPLVFFIKRSVAQMDHRAGDKSERGEKIR